MFKKQLTKKELSLKYNKYNISNICKNKNEFINFLNQIEKEFYNHSFKSDYRYLYTGRQKYLIAEMKQLYYTKEQYKEQKLSTCPTVFCLYSLIEIMCNPNFLNIEEYNELPNSNELYKNKDLAECRKIYDSYISDEIISLQERDHIMHALIMIRESLDKCNNEMDWI